MEISIFTFMELFVVLAFALGWGVLELVCRRLDRQRSERIAQEEAERARAATEPRA